MEMAVNIRRMSVQRAITMDPTQKTNPDITKINNIISPQVEQKSSKAHRYCGPTGFMYDSEQEDYRQRIQDMVVAQTGEPRDMEGLTSSAAPAAQGDLREDSPAQGDLRKKAKTESAHDDDGRQPS